MGTKSRYLLTVFVNTYSEQSETISMAIAEHIEDTEVKGLSFNGTATQGVIILSFRSESKMSAIKKTLEDAGLHFILSKTAILPPNIEKFFDDGKKEKEKPLDEQLKEALDKEDYEEATRIRNKIEGKE